ncbi:MAG: cation:proton antiporter [Nanoarchaeota archaeon]
MTLDILTIITLCLALSFFLSQLCRKFKLPEILGQISAGALLTLPFFAGLITPKARTDIGFLSEIGIIFLLLLAGLEINIHKLKKLSKDSMLISIFGAVIPFVFGFFAITLLGYDTSTALITAICLAITAEGITLKVLIDKNMLDTKVGTIILSAGILDDLYGVVFLGAFLTLLRDNSAGLLAYPFMILGFIGVVLILFYVLPKFIKTVEKEHSRVANLSMTIIIGLAIASISSKFGLGQVLGAFIAGVIIHFVNKEKKEEHDIVTELKILTFAFIIPFFFIDIGLKMDFATILQPSNLWMIIVISAVAIAGKLLGSMVVSYFSDITFRQSILIGWGMNSRGAIELVIASVALNAGLLPLNIYTAIVIMTLLTTLFFPFILDKTVKKYPKIMNE